MKKLNVFGVERAIEVLRAGKFMIRCWNQRHSSMGGVDVRLFGPGDIPLAVQFGEDVMFAFEHEVED
jgi:hypothetical protein